MGEGDRQTACMSYDIQTGKLLRAQSQKQLAPSLTGQYNHFFERLGFLDVLDFPGAFAAFVLMRSFALSCNLLDRRRGSFRTLDGRTPLLASEGGRTDLSILARAVSGADIASSEAKVASDNFHKESQLVSASVEVRLYFISRDLSPYILRS